MTITITLPWPPAVLSPNARAHWTAKAKAAAKVRRDACYLAQAAGARMLPWAGMAVAIEFRPPDRRLYDTDNLLARCKAALDGVADATGIDDSRWTYRLARGEPVKGGAVVVLLEPPQCTALYRRIIGAPHD